METKPYVLSVVGHKGGSGKTTTALALAWTWGQMGRGVALVDPDGSAGLIANGSDGQCNWANVRIFPSVRPALVADFAVVILDGPSLTDPACWSLLGQADGSLLTCPAEVLSLRGLPLATEILAQGYQRAVPPTFHGILLTRFRDDPHQQRIRSELERMEGDLLFSPSVPEDAGVRTWAMTPGAELPSGPARSAYLRVAEELDARLGLPLAREVLS